MAPSNSIKKTSLFSSTASSIVVFSRVAITGAGYCSQIPIIKSSVYNINRFTKSSSSYERSIDNARPSLIKGE